MDIYIAEHAGYCFGVKNAVDKAVETIKDSKNGSVYSFGPLIHNPQVVEKLNKDGLKVIDSIEGVEQGNVIVRAHGAPREVEEEIESSGFKLIDCTCPYVKSVHEKVNEYHKKGYQIIIIGSRDHPEVIGINGWCNNDAVIVDNEEEAKNLLIYDKLCIVSQTTNTLKKFERLSKIIEDQGKEVKIINTICNATSLRQIACKDLAKKVDAMIVVGGYHSSNTNKLAEISRSYCKNVYHIEIYQDLPLQEIGKFNIIGITAGASTPDWIIREVVDTVDKINNENNDNNEKKVDINGEAVATEEETNNEVVDTNEETMDKNDEIMEAIEKSMVTIQKGDVITGNVIYVTEKEVMVNINYKSDGIIAKEELSNDPNDKPKDLFSEGDEVEVYVVRLDDGEGNVVLSIRRLRTIKAWEELEEIYENKEEVECEVLTDVKGGLSVLINGVTGFMPASQISVKYVDDLSEYRNENLKARIIDLDKTKNRIILSGKAIEQEELKEVKDEIWDTLEIGNIIKGEIVRLTDFGAFVDIGGLDGLIHISDLSWMRIKHPSEVISIGDEVEVEVLNFNREKNRISLGLKQTLAKPWGIFIGKREIGDIVSGKVVNILDFGAFVRLEEGVDGLVHVSQIANEHISKPSDKLEIGEDVIVKIIDIKEEDERISLSIKAVNEEEEEREEKETNVNIKNEEMDVNIGDMIKDK